MNTTLTPGVRKLPSALDIQILNTLRTPQPIANRITAALTAPLNADALIAINNGSFDTNTDWYIRGDSHILNGQAILSEDSPYLSHLSQTFVIPQGAKALQFTLVNTDLHSSNIRLAPGDAFEVALLNHTTNTSVLAPQHGKVSLNPNGTVTYQPTANYIGSDRFTYLIQDNSGVYSTPAVVNINILNPIPTIDTVAVDRTLNEGTPAQFSAAATIAGNQPLTYTWTLGDGTTTTGQTIPPSTQITGSIDRAKELARISKGQS